jgi:cell division septation protein DedD
MKCLQKDPTKRYQSVTDFEIALVKAAKARRASPWEAAINRAMDHAEIEVRRYMSRGAEEAKLFIERKDWRSLTQIQNDPVAMLGVTGIAAALVVFLLFGTWKSRTTNAQIVPVTTTNPTFQVSPLNPVSGSKTQLAPISTLPIGSNAVDLYEDLRNAGAKDETPDPVPTKKGIQTEPIVTALSPQTVRTAKAPKSQTSTAKRNRTSDSPASGKLEALNNSTQPEIAMTPDRSASANPEPATNSSQPSAVPEPVVQPENLLAKPQNASQDPKAPKLYIEVGTFKDETWANNAVDKLNQLGFHALLIQKSLLWSQSYHVQVGPYPDQKSVEEARKSLVSQGFKVRPVN